MENNLNLYNTLTKRVERFVPNEPGRVKMYTCGPTVYHFAHIGNLRSYIMEDVLEKFLRYSGYEVERVMNITDVGHLSSDADTGEDKMLKGAKREHKTVMEIAKFYTDAFFSDCARLHIRRPDVVEPATNCIADFIRMIEALMEKGYAYQAGGNIYFDTAKLDEYYVLSNQNAEELAVGVRESVEEDENKRNKTDFVLWFTKSKFDDQELKWESPWGVGYPGWHIECSAISIRHLGERLDIHCGGIDNVFPHHTNEIAQSESYLGHKWCNYWFHILHLNDAEGKMSKSRGDFLTVSLLENQGYNPLVYRMFCLQSHYRKPLVFSFAALDNVAAAYEKLAVRIAALLPDGGAGLPKTAEQDAGNAGQSLKAQQNTPEQKTGKEQDMPGLTAGEQASGKIEEEKLAALRKAFLDAMNGDLNTSSALTVLYDVLKTDADSATKLAAIREFDEVLSLGLLEAAENVKKSREAKSADAAADADGEFAAWVEQKIEERKAAKKNKDFTAADAIREELAARGVVIRDTREGTVWELA